MKKILILALTALASLGLTFGATLAFKAAGGGDEVNSLSDLVGKSFEVSNPYNDEDVYIDIIFNVGTDTIYHSISYTDDTLYFDDHVANEGTNHWASGFGAFNVYTEQTITGTGSIELFLSWLTDFNGGLSEYNVPVPAEPAETPTMWQAILSGIGGFFSGMFSVLSGLFSGVVAVFYTNNTTTIVLQALIFAAAAGLVAAAVYVIVRLIKSAIARLRGGVGGAGGYYINDKRVSRFAFKRNILKNEGRLALRSWKSGNRRYRRLLRARRK